MDEHDSWGREMKREKDKATEMFYTNVVLWRILFQLKRDRDRYVLGEYRTFNHPVLVGRRRKENPSKYSASPCDTWIGASRQFFSCWGTELIVKRHTVQSAHAPAPLQPGWPQVFPILEKNLNQFLAELGLVRHFNVIAQDEILEEFWEKGPVDILETMNYF